MFATTVSVPQAIKEILSSNNLYLQALLSGIANYTALAQKIKPDIEKLTGSNVNKGTIVVAIKRLVDNLRNDEGIQNNPTVTNANPIIEGARMSLTGNIIDIDFNEFKFDPRSHIFPHPLDKQA